MNKDLVAAIARLVDYMEYEERSHYEENGEPSEHIYNDVRFVSQWLNKELQIHQ